MTGRRAGTEGSPRCHAPATFEPEAHAALLQVSVLQTDLDSIAAHLVDCHLRYCVNRAVAEDQTPEEVQAMLVPVQSLLFARR